MTTKNSIKMLQIVFWSLCLVFRLNVAKPLSLGQDVFLARIMQNQIRQSILIGVLIFIVGKQLIDSEKSLEDASATK